MRGWKVMLCEEFPDIVRHRLIRKQITVGRAAVIASVERKDSERFAERLGDRMPIIGRAEQAVENDQRFAGITVGLEMKVHRSSAQQQQSL